MAKKTDETSPKKTNGDGASKQPEEAGSRPGAEQPAEQNDPHLTVLAQYVKDLSFENPNAPQSLQGPGENPQLKVSVNVNATPRGEEMFEVLLNLEVHARSEAGVIYNTEMVYGGLFRLHNVPQARLQPVLFVDCPIILFPFLRRLLADITRDGGFPPLMLDPIDFNRLYHENLARGQEQSPQAKN
jgi:preprotein translocase subunit SecB